jgi:hypothetical protein
MYFPIEFLFKSYSKLIEYHLQTISFQIRTG